MTCVQRKIQAGAAIRSDGGAEGLAGCAVTRDGGVAPGASLLGFAGALFFAGMVSFAGATAYAQENAATDSQVEASVLKALASAPDLARQSITTRTVYGVVTLSGNVESESARTEAENLAANASGVKKVVDELQIGGASQAAGDAQDASAGQATSSTNGSANQTSPAPGMVLQSDGTYAPAPAAADGAPAQQVPAGQAAGTAPASGATLNDPEHDQAQYGPPKGTNAGGQAQPYPASPAYGNGQGAQPGYPQGSSPQQAGSPQQGSYPQRGYPQQQGNSSSQNYPSQNYPSQNYPPQNQYPGYPPANPQGQYPQNGYPPAGSQAGVQPWGGQVAGEAVVVPVGTMVRIRVDRVLASDRLHAGDTFEGFVAHDIVAGGFVAIPRGAAVQGKVVDAKSSGAISGRGELSVQLTSVTLGGHVYPLLSDTWTQAGPSKTGNTVANAAGLGVAGALIGAIVGRGAGAAIGAGAGAAAGIGVSAAESKGQVVVPPEGMLTFHLAEPTDLRTVSEQEIQRLAYGVPPGEAPRRPMYARPYSGYGYPPPPPSPYYYPRY